MLPPFIIDQIREREEEERRQREHQPVLELPLYVPQGPIERPRREEKEPEKDRGVVIIDLLS